MGIEAIRDIIESRADLAKEQRNVEAEAFAVMRTRPTFFALKLLFGMNHKPIEEEPDGEPDPISAADQQPAAA